jgi:hypothetical protein
LEWLAYGKGRVPAICEELRMGKLQEFGTLVAGRGLRREGAEEEAGGSSAVGPFDFSNGRSERVLTGRDN